jgi:hypothetical protein
MSETSMPGTPSVPEVQGRLHEVATILRASSSLDGESRRVLAELVEELSRLLNSAAVPPGEVAHLAESTAHLAESLHHQQDTGMLGKARERLEGAVVNAETHAPVAVGLARRVLDALSNIGI